jgi:phospholipase C
MRGKLIVRIGAVGVVTVLAVAGCSQPASSGNGSPRGTVSVSASSPAATPSASRPSASRPSAARPSATGGSATATTRYTKVLVIAEENHAFDQVIGDASAPYINSLATTYGLATNMDAGYPAACPSLAAYILLTSGSTDRICDDNSPAAHPITGPNIFAQVVAAGGEWRNYAESATDACSTTNGNNGRFLVRHTPAAYYLSEAQRCPRWDLPLGTPTAGALHDDLTGGTLPAYGFVTPDACDDMHGAPACAGSATVSADSWLHTWIPMIVASPDYTSGRLAVIITWDEGSASDNHIPTLIVSPTTRHVRSATGFTHCSTLRTAEEILHLPLLGCAATAASMLGDFHLTPS